MNKLMTMPAGGFSGLSAGASAVVSTTFSAVLPTVLSTVLLAAFSVLALGGCSSVGPDYQTPQLKLPASYSQAAPLGPAGAPVAQRQDWWLALQDARLAALMNRMFSSNPDLQLAAARLQQARAVQQAEGAAGNPQLNADGRLSSDRLSLNSENFANVPFKNPLNQFVSRQAGFDASWELDFWGRQNRIDQGAEARSQAVQLRAEDLRLQLSAELVRDYVLVRSLQLRQQLAQQSLSLFDSYLKLQRLQRTAGELSELDLQRAQALRDNFAAGLPAIEQSRRISVAALSVLTGLAVADLELQLAGTADGLPAALPALPAAPAQGLPAELLRRRPDVQAAERDLAAASADIGVAVSDLYPRFALTGSAGWNSIHQDNLISQGSQSWSLGPQFSLPLLNRGRLHARVAANQAAFSASAAAYQKSVLTALADVEVALSQLATALDSQQQSQRAGQALQVQLGLLEKQHRAGEQSRLPLLDQQRQWLAQQDAVLQAQSQSLLAYVALNKALGGGWQMAAQQ